MLIFYYLIILLIVLLLFLLFLLTRHYEIKCVTNNGVTNNAVTNRISLKWKVWHNVTNIFIVITWYYSVTLFWKISLFTNNEIIQYIILQTIKSRDILIYILLNFFFTSLPIFLLVFSFYLYCFFAFIVFYILYFFFFIIFYHDWRNNNWSPSRKS